MTTIDYDMAREQLAATDKILDGAEEKILIATEALITKKKKYAAIARERQALRTLLRAAGEPYTKEETET